MSSGEAMKPMQVVQVGPDAVGADTLRDLIARPDIPFKLEAIATVNPDLRGKKLRDTHLKGPSELDEVPLIGIIDAIEKTDARIIFSNLEPKLVSRYETRLAAGRLVVTGGSVGRERPEVPVVSAFVNPDHIDELYSRPDMEGRVIDTGSSLSALISVALAPLHREIGIESMSITTLQGWSDVGMHRLPELADDKRSGIRDIIDEQKHEEAQADLNRLLGESMDRSADIGVTQIRLQHGSWLRGHHARIVARLSKAVSKKQIEDMWRNFEAPEELRAVRAQLRAISKAGGDKWPGRHGPIKPVKLEHGDLLRSYTRIARLDRIQPMRVGTHILEFDPDDPMTLTFEVSGDNLMQGGLPGSGLLNAMYARAQGYLGG